MQGYARSLPPSVTIARFPAQDGLRALIPHPAVLEPFGDLLQVGVQLFIKLMLELVIVLLVEAFPSLYQMIGVSVD